jgi:hypothetical protein
MKREWKKGWVLKDRLLRFVNANEPWNATARPWRVLCESYEPSS